MSFYILHKLFLSGHLIFGRIISKIILSARVYFLNYDFFQLLTLSKDIH